MEYTHEPVMLEECLTGLSIKPEGIYADGTAGLGGHSLAICEKLTTGKLIAIDKDIQALTICKERLAGFKGRVSFIHGDFRNISSILDDGSVDGILLDIGVSSLQLDNPERGFSYRYDAPLDMRMDPENPLDAAFIVNEWELGDIKRILYDYGEERYAPAIAKAIVASRPVGTTKELCDIVASVMPAKSRREKQHPARRTFQALRIAVNDELGALREVLSVAADKLLPGGRLCVITFHSLEDRIVKQAFNKLSRSCVCPPDFPVCVCGNTAKGKIIGVFTPGERELLRNKRAECARLRIIEKAGE